jgi:hypothetical protein
MQKIFENPLPTKDKVSDLHLVAEGEDTSIGWNSTTHTKQSTSSRVPLSAKMKGFPGDDAQLSAMGSIVEGDTATAVEFSAQSPARALRSTRASRSLFDVELPSDPHVVEKYSETHGLGKPWDK